MQDTVSLSNANAGSSLNDESENETVQGYSDPSLTGRQVARIAAGTLISLVPISQVIDSVWIVVVVAIVIGVQTLQWILLRGVQRHFGAEGRQVAKALGVYVPAIKTQRAEKEPVCCPPAVSAPEAGTHR